MEVFFFSSGWCRISAWFEREVRNLIYNPKWMEHLVNFLCLPLHKVEYHILKLNFVTTRQGGKGTAMSCSKNQKCLSFFEQGCRFPKGDVTVDNSKRQFLVQWCCVKTWCWVTWVRGHFLCNFYVTSFWTGIKNFRCQIINSTQFVLWMHVSSIFCAKAFENRFCFLCCPKIVLYIPLISQFFGLYCKLWTKFLTKMVNQKG